MPARLHTRLLILLVLLGACQQRKDKFAQPGAAAAYHSSYDDSTLNRAAFPVLMPYNRILDPAGETISWGDPGEENHSLQIKALPGTPWILVLDRYGIALVNIRLHRVEDRWSYALKPEFKGFMSTFSGLAISDERQTSIFLSAASTKGHQSAVIQLLILAGKLVYVKHIDLPPLSPSPLALPNGLALHSENGKRYLYIILNGNNQLLKYDLNSDSVVWSVPTGVAPYGICILRNSIYVTNWGGNLPRGHSSTKAGDTVETAGVPYGNMEIDSRTGASLQGSVSVYEPVAGAQISNLQVGLHPNDITGSESDGLVYVANANSDEVSVIDATDNRLIQRVPVRLMPGKSGFIGDSPNALALSPNGKTLYVACGLDNAAAVISLAGRGAARLAGFIPTGAYPGALALQGDTLLVANLEGTGARVDSKDLGYDPSSPKIKKKKARAVSSSNSMKDQDESPGAVSAFNAHHQLASLSFIPIPDSANLPLTTFRVQQLCLLFRAELASQIPRKHVPARPMPTRIGEPSVFKHVIYIIKENRSYDQVLGDMTEGNGKKELCIFGQRVTPNEHALAQNFLLMDNYHVSGKSSAEGHQWTDAAMVTDYVEKSVRAWFRSYPHVQEDALVYDAKGFIWNHAADFGKSVRVYGEACIPHYAKGTTWTDFYTAYKAGRNIPFTNTSTISRVRGMLSRSYPGYNSHDINDQIRADAFLGEFRQAARAKGDRLPALMLLALPSDHTGGSSPGLPTPRAMVADNDMALGRIVEEVSKSRFWKNTVIFVTEDDSQNGWDHVSAYRTTGFVISPYSRLSRTIHTNYNQTSMVRSIEQILGIPPMNTIDATASPMFDCFTNKPSFAPWSSQKNLVPLDEMNPGLTQLKGKDLYYAHASRQPQFRYIDGGDDDLLNRILWHSAKTGRPYPETRTR